ncbi:hypothetical protein SLS60_004507 [Paraconiothyrium brasiliense]|uniref:Uncharacterized protein n=1 Tax=Paraconiothyrium brasiliense TaxID=300254 RepID=A0ABR3RKK1_9PLEO
MAKRGASTNITSPHKKRTRTFKKAQQADNDVDASQPASPFFNKLNLDVRMIVYEYLNGRLPPLASKFVQRDCRGLVLSCKRANLELSEAAARHLKLWMKDFTNDLEERHERPVTLYKPIPLHDGWQAIRSIVLKIDVRFRYNEEVPCYLEDGCHTRVSELHYHRGFYSWHYGLDIDLYEDASNGIAPKEILRILRKPFDKVTILFTCPSQNALDPEGTQIHDLSVISDVATTVQEDDDLKCPEEESDDDFKKCDSDDSEDTAIQAKFENILAHLETMHQNVVSSICSDWMGVLAIKDHQQCQRYKTRPDLIQPHDFQGLLFDNRSSCRKCQEDCAQHWKCTHPDECHWSCDVEAGYSACYGRCDGLDSMCPWPHEFIGKVKAQRSCENKLADDAFTLGPKLGDYETQSDYRFACVQWERIFGDCEAECHGPGKLNLDGYECFFGKPTGKEPQRFQTNEIVYAWDFRASIEPFRGKLTGGTFRYGPKYVKDLAEYEHLHVPTTTAEYDEQWPSRYLLESEDLMVGMVGIKHPKRWVLASQELCDPDGMPYSGINEFLHEYYGARRTETESLGVGMPIVELRRSKKKA